MVVGWPMSRAVCFHFFGLGLGAAFLLSRAFCDVVASGVPDGRFRRENDGFLTGRENSGDDGGEFSGSGESIL